MDISPYRSICLESVWLQLEASEEPRIVTVGLLRIWFALVVSAQSSWEPQLLHTNPRSRAEETCEEACPPRRRHHLTKNSASTSAATAMYSLRTPRLGHLTSGKRHYTYGTDTVCKRQRSVTCWYRRMKCLEAHALDGMQISQGANFNALGNGFHASGQYAI